MKSVRFDFIDKKLMEEDEQDGTSNDKSDAKNPRYQVDINKLN